MKSITLGNTIEDLNDLVEAINDEVIKPCEDSTCTGEDCPAGIHFGERAVYVDNSNTPYGHESVSHGCGSALVRFELDLIGRVAAEPVSGRQTSIKYGLVPLLFDISHPDYYLEVRSVTIQRDNNVEMKIEWDGDA